MEDQDRPQFSSNEYHSFELDLIIVGRIHLLDTEIYRLIHELENEPLDTIAKTQHDTIIRDRIVSLGRLRKKALNLRGVNPKSREVLNWSNPIIRIFGTDILDRWYCTQFDTL